MGAAIAAQAASLAGLRYSAITTRSACVGSIET